MSKPAARIGDMHVCPMVTPGVPPIPHVGGPIMGPGVPTVLIGGMPAAVMGDMCTCVGPPDSVILGSTGVLVGGKPAARMGDMTAHGGTIMIGCPTVLIGEISPGTVMTKTSLTILEQMPQQQQLITMQQAAHEGKPFCEICNIAAPAPEDEPPKDEDFKKIEATPTSGDDKDKPKLEGFSEGVKDLVGKSPTLTEKLKSLEDDGWTIEYGEAGKGTYVNRKEKKIVIDTNQKGNDTRVVQSLAHEAGHATYTKEPYVQPKGKTKEQYVNENTNTHLKDEGEATLVNLEVRDEIIDNGGDDIGVAGKQTEKYKKAFESYEKDKDRDKARSEIGEIFANGENPSTDTSKTYKEYYSKTYEDFWDKHVAPKSK